MKKLKAIVLCLFFLLYAGQAMANNIDVSIGINHFSIGSQLKFYKDETGGLRAENIIGNTKIDWKKINNDVPNFGFDNSNFWFILSLVNSSKIESKRVIAIDYPLLDQIDVYAYSKNKLIKQYRSGDNVAFNNRPIRSRLFGFPIEIPANDELTILLNMKTEGAAQLPIDILEESEFHDNYHKSVILEVIFVGAVLGIAIYNLMLYLSIRESNVSYLYYIGYVLSYCMLHLTFRGIGYQWVWPSYIGVNETIFFICLCSTVIFSLLFSNEFLDLKNERKWLYKLTSLILIIVFVALLSSFSFSYSFKVQFLVVIVILASIIMFYAGITQWVKGSRAAKIYSIAWVVFLVGALLIGLNKFGIIPRTFITEYATQIGTTLVAFLLSLALAERINAAQKKNMELQKMSLDIQRKANDELEERVQSRTRDLEKALNELSIANVELNNLRTIDSLTQINNRTFFDETIYKEWKRASRSHQTLSLMMIDVDHFKPINDTYGHLAGDEVLKQIAQIISLTVKRPSDTLARYGGEEFSIILPHTEFEGAMALAERIRSVCEQSELIAHNTKLSVTISIGVSSILNFDTSNYEISDLVDFADKALYQSKQKGRNQVNGSILGEQKDS